MTTETLRIAPTTMKDQFDKILRSLEFPDEKANTLARIFMENSLDGVYTHGVNRYPEFVEYVRRGFIRIDGEPECVHGVGGVEGGNGNAGHGMLNELRCADRAMEIGSEGGIGCVGLDI